MSSLNIFKQFLVLGCLSFGGPAAHIGFFRRRFVQELRWVSDQEFGEIVALCHFLPGPSSSQVGFSIGHRMAGLAGACSAFIGFTLPSFVIMLSLVFGSEFASQTEWFAKLIHGLKLVAVIVVFDAILSMGNIFCTEPRSRAIAAFTCATVVLINLAATPVLCIMTGAVLGYILGTKAVTIGRATDASSIQLKGSIGTLSLFIFFLLLIGLPFVSSLSNDIELFTTFFQAGSLVFGGGHVVLPLLQSSLSDSLSNDQLLTGYAAAQAVPGPMFTIATYLGGLSSPSTLVAALIATAAIFLPGFLLVLALQKSWKQLSQYNPVSNAIWGINASVVGILAAAFVTLIIPSSINGSTDIFICILGILLIRFLTLPTIVLIMVVLILSLIV